MKRSQPENRLQADIVNYLRAVLPQWIVAAIPNASRRTESGAAGNAVPGLYPGLPDLMIVGPLGRAAFIEVKADGGRVSAVQSAVHGRMAVLGIPYCVARSIEHVREALAVWGIKTREAPQGQTFPDQRKNQRPRHDSVPGSAS